MTRRRLTLLVLAAYTLSALVLTYPLLLNFADTIPGVQGDVWSYLWAMGWARTSALDLGVNPFHTDYVFYPLGGATQLLWATALPSFASLPFQLAFGLVPAFNLVYLAATVLTAYGTYLVAAYVLTRRGQRSAGAGRRILSSPSPVDWRVATGAYIAGLAFAFCALRLGYGLAFTNLYHTEFIPFYILALLKTGDEPAWMNPISAGILLGLNAYIDFQIAVFLILFTILWSVFLLARKRFFPHVVARALVLAGIAALVALPMIAIVTQDLSTEGGNYIRVYPLKYSAPRSYDLLAYELPNARSSLYQLLPAPRVAGVNAAVNVDGESQLSPDRQSFLGLTVLVLAVIGVLKHPRTLALWLGAAILFALLSFGPTLHMAGLDLGIPLPYAALHEAPIANHIRIPMRYGIVTFLSMAVLAGAGASELAAGFPPLPLAGILTVFVLGEAAALPYPTLSFSVPAIYNRIAAEPGDFSVLEIPTFNWRAAAVNEVFQVIHHKRILRAYTNRIAPDVADYFGQRQTPVVVRSLRVLEGAEDGPLSPQDKSQDRASGLATLQFFKIRYAIVHRGWFADEDTAQIDQYLRGVLGGSLVFEDGTVSAYKFDYPAATSAGLSLDLAADASLLYLGRGWQTEPLAAAQGVQGRFVNGGASEFYFGGTAQRVQLRVFSEKKDTVVQFRLNGRDVNTTRLGAGWAEYDLSLPPELVQSDMNNLQMLHPPPDADRIAVSSFEIH